MSNEERAADKRARQLKARISKADSSAHPPGKSGRASTETIPDLTKATAKDGVKDGKKQRSRTRRYLRRAAFGMLGFMVLLFAGFVITYLVTPIPDTAQADATAQGSIFRFSDGSMIGRKGRERTPVKLDQVPRHVQDAVIAAENRSFRNDPGVSVKGTTRALWSTLTGGSAQGGSTITQQMVRNYYSGLSQERTVSRKLKEIMVALKVGRERDKDWILENYLNTIYFGRDAYGIEAASKAYYGKSVGKLTPAESAYLAAAIQLPNYYDKPTGDVRPAAEARWRYVVGGMVKIGTITQADANAMTFPKPIQRKHTEIYRGMNGYMLAVAENELKQRGYTADEILRGGLDIKTTFDPTLMKHAKDAVESTVPRGLKRTRAGLVAVEPKTGRVLAFYGGKDYLKQAFDNAFDAKVQSGSGFKPYALAAALEKGETLNTLVDGSSPQTFDGTPVRNDSGTNFGMVNLVTATQRSVNTAYVALGEKVGLQNVVKAAEKAGIPSSQLEQHASAVTLPLGVADVSVAQQASGFSTFANEGYHQRMRTVESVKKNGKVTKIRDPRQQAYDKKTAWDTTYAMTKVVQNGTGTRARLYDRPVAGKTGTTSAGKQIWFNGFIPQMSASVAVFRSDNKPLKIPGYDVYGGELPAQIWRTFTQNTINTKQWQPEQFHPPSTYAAPQQRPQPTRSTSPRPSPSDPDPSPSDPDPTDPTDPPTSPRPTNSPRPRDGVDKKRSSHAEKHVVAR